MVLMYEEEELYSGLEGGEGERDQTHGYSIQDLLRLYWIGYKRNVLNYQSSTSLQSPVAMLPVVCN